jgi:hypothetical protein
MALMSELNCTDEQFADNLVAWADGIRRTFSVGGVNDIITTRRLAQIIRLYSIFDDRKKAISHATARFNSESREAFINLYDKVDSTPEPITENELPVENVTEDPEFVKKLADKVASGVPLSPEDVKWTKDAEFAQF